MDRKSRQAVVQVCGVKSAEAGIWRFPGTHFQNECTVDVLKLLRSASSRAGDTSFYDLYFVTRVQPATSGALPDEVRLELGVEGPLVLYPVPVIVANMPGNTQALVRRIFVTDAELGHSQDTDKVAWVQYPAEVKLRIQVCTWC
jgi:hypothetical protein